MFGLQVFYAYTGIFTCHLATCNIAKLQVMVNSAEKVRLAGNPNVMVCERGTMFGYSKDLFAMQFDWSNWCIISVFP